MTANAEQRNGESLAERIRALASLPSAHQPQFHPDGRSLTYLSDRGGLPEIWQQSLTDEQAPTRLSQFTDPVQDLRWSPDGRWLACQVAPGGGMNSQIYLLQADGQKAFRVSSGGQSNNWLGDWLPDRSALLYLSNHEDVACLHVYAYRLASRQTARLTDLGSARPGTTRIADIRADGGAILLERVHHRSDGNVYSLDPAGGRETLLTAHEGPGSYNGARFRPDGAAIYLVTDHQRDRTAFCRIALADDGTPGPIEALRERADATLDGFALTKDGEQAALSWNIAGRSEIELLDLATLQTRPVPLPAAVLTQQRYSPDGQWLALALTDARLAGDIWLCQRQTATLRRFSESAPAESLPASSQPAALVSPELRRFAAHDGLELSGWLYRARAEAAGPTVIHFHGGPEGQARPVYRYDFQALLAAGISIFDPNVRGSSGFGKTFVNLDNGALRFDGIRDIEACARHLLDSGIAAPGQLGIMGGSYGGYMTMAGLSHYPELFAAGANLFGVVNFFTFFEQTEPWMAAISTVKYGDPASEPELLRALSPIFQLERVRAATLVIHGVNDTNVPVVEAEQVVEGLQARGIPCEYILFQDEGHGWTRAENKITSTAAITRWFQQYLAG